MPKVIKITRGLNIPMLGEADRILMNAPLSDVYGIKPTDFHGLTPKLLVNEGDLVKIGSPLFKDKANERILFTSPVSGVVKEVVRGEKRKILEVVVAPDGNQDYIEFGIFDPLELDRNKIIDRMLVSGAWPLVRQRPFSIVANPSDVPKAIFVSAFNTAPLACDLDFVVNGNEKYFQTGLNALYKLAGRKVNLSVDARNTKSQAFLEAQNVVVHHFDGPHPAGNVGIQIHHISPINKGEVVWHVDVSGVITIGRLFSKGYNDASRTIALVGTEVPKPRYYKLIAGARIYSITSDHTQNLDDSVLRYISGNVLSGTRVNEKGFLGFYDEMVTVIPEGTKPEVLGWLIPNPKRFSASRTWPSFLMPWKKYRLDTMVRSGERPFVMTGIYEKVLPMDILPMFLLKAIMVNDIEKMEQLGIYEVAPEDLALCEFVCPSKIEIQSWIRDGLDSIRAEFS